MCNIYIYSFILGILWRKGLRTKPWCSISDPFEQPRHNTVLYGSTTAVATCGQHHTVKEILLFLP